MGTTSAALKPPRLEPHLSVREAALYLGGERYVRRLIAERRITYVKDQRRVLIPESAVADYLAARTVPAAAPRQRVRRYRKAA